MNDAVRVRGLRELERAFGKASRDLKDGLKAELLTAAEPVRQQAEQIAVQTIPRIGPMRPRSWARMRAGHSTRFALTYIAPRQRGRMSRANPALARPKFARTLLRPMEQSLERNHQSIIQRLEFVLDIVRDRNGFG